MHELEPVGEHSLEDVVQGSRDDLEGDEEDFDQRQHFRFLNNYIANITPLLLILFFLLLCLLVSLIP